jgi:hypothetical protein
MNIVLALVVIVVMGLLFLRWYNEAKEAGLIAESDIDPNLPDGMDTEALNIIAQNDAEWREMTEDVQVTYWKRQGRGQ